MQMVTPECCKKQKGTERKKKEEKNSELKRKSQKEELCFLMFQIQEVKLTDCTVPSVSPRSLLNPLHLQR